jgi:hypothetical protein
MKNAPDVFSAPHFGIRFANFTPKYSAPKTQVILGVMLHE